jgi:hypothetical protein
MKRRFVPLTFVIIGFFTVGILNAAGRLDLRGTVPEAQREPFQAVLKRAIEAQEERNWSVLYSVQWLPPIENASFQEFEKASEDRGWDLKDFTVLEISHEVHGSTNPTNGTWTVFGCARILDGNKVKDKNATIMVYFGDGKWFAGDVGLIIPMDGGADWPPCRLGKGKTLQNLWTPGRH